MNPEDNNLPNPDLEAVQSESITDPLENGIGNDDQNESKTDSGIDTENSQNEGETHQDEVGDVKDKELEDHWNTPDIDENEGLEDLEDEDIEDDGIDSETSTDSQENGSEDSATHVEAETDPLDGMGKKESYEMKDYLAGKEPSAEYKKKLEGWGRTGLDYVDDMKATICVAIGGGHVSEYAADNGIKDAFFEATLELAKHKEFKAPTPTQAFIVALLAMIIPSLGLAGFRKFTKKVESFEPPQKQAASDLPQAKTDYTSTKEYQAGRKKFKIFASNGAYQYDNKDAYVAIKYANDYPSPEIQKLLDENKSSSEIKNILYGE